MGVAGEVREVGVSSGKGGGGFASGMISRAATGRGNYRGLRGAQDDGGGDGDGNGTGNCNGKGKGKGKGKGNSNGNYRGPSLRSG